MDGRAEERYVTNPNGDTEVEAKDGLEKNAACEGEWNRQNHVRGFSQRSVNQEEDDKNNSKDHWQDKLQGPLGPELVLILAAPLDGHPGRQSDLFLNTLTRLLHKSPEVTVLHIGLHKDPKTPIFAGDLARSGVAPDFRDLPERDVFAGLSSHKDFTNAFNVVPLTPLEANLDWKSLASFDGRCHVLSTQAGFHHIQNILRF